MDIRTAIRKRISVRHYLNKPVPDKILSEVLKAGIESIPLVSGIETNFHLVKEGRQIAGLLTPLTGSRLLFGSAPHFIIATSAENPLFMLNTGFSMEQMILHATRLELGTCWIGGMFSDKKIRALLKLPDNEQIIALTPLGYPDMSLLGKAARDIIEAGAMRFGRRKALKEITSGKHWNEPLVTENNEVLELLECARRSPSWANTQPWHFLVNQDTILALADSRERYDNIRSGKHYYRLDVGIAMAHIFLAARELGWNGKWQVSGINSEVISEKYGIPGYYEVAGIYHKK